MWLAIEIDDVISKLKTDIENTELNHLTVLKKEEDKINNSLTEITEKISELKKILDSNDACLLLKYNSRNEEFKRLPPKLIVHFSSLSSKEIDKKLLNQQFGSLSALSITTEKRVYTLKTPETNTPYSDNDDDELLKLWRRKNMFHRENLELFNHNFYNWIMYVTLGKQSARLYLIYWQEHTLLLSGYIE